MSRSHLNRMSMEDLRAKAFSLTYSPNIFPFGMDTGALLETVEQEIMRRMLADNFYAKR